MQVISNAEIEFPIFEKVGIRGVVFFDMGNAYNLEDQYCTLRPSNVDAIKNPCIGPARLSAPTAPSWGFGFRWFSPIGPLRFEWGIPLRTAARRGADRLRVHDRQLLLNRVKQRPLPEGDDKCHASSQIPGRSGLLARLVGGVRRGHEARLRRHAARAQRDRGRPQGEGQAQEGLRPEAEGARRAAGSSSRRTSRTSTRSGRCCRPTRSARRRPSCRRACRRCSRPTCATSRTCRPRSRRRRRKIFERMTKIIAKIAAAENFSMILDKSALVFAKPHLDLTNELIRRYNGGEGADGRPARRRRPRPASPRSRRAAVLDIRAIERILPHRYPFLLVDRVDEIGDERIVARKLVIAQRAVLRRPLPRPPGDARRADHRGAGAGGRAARRARWSSFNPGDARHLLHGDRQGEVPQAGRARATC